MTFLASYLERIGYRGPTAPTLATLSGLLTAHMLAIPFENLDVLLGRRVRVDLAGVHDKLVVARRGGYCFEHGTLFAAVIEELGFHPVRHSARVVLFEPRTQSPRTHMFLTVALPEGRFVVDPGFGGPAALFPIPLAEAEPGAATHWMARDGDIWVLRTPQGDAWVSTLEQDHPIDFEMANHFVATHPDSIFVNWLLLSRFTPAGRVSVMNRDVTIVQDGERQTTQLADRAALRALLATQFGIDLPEAEGLRVPAIADWV